MTDLKGLQLRFFKKGAEIVTAVYKEQHLKPREDIGFAPIGLDEPYRIVVGNNPVNWIDPLGLDPIDSATGEVNPVLRCHVNPHTDRMENLKGAGILLGAIVLATAPEAIIGFKKNLKDLQFDGPKGSRICQVRYKKQPVCRLDYGAYPGTKGQPRLHGHLPLILPNKHIPLDPRRFFE